MTMGRKGGLAAAAVLCAMAPTGAMACGGLFCNNSTPVVQQGERILFAVDGDHTVMDVRISYGGPPQEFGWLLPVPRGVETSLGSELAFQMLDNFQTRFQPTYEQVVQCPNDGDSSGAGGSSAGPEGEPDAGVSNGVDVLSREAVGPYDRAILDARSVEDLRAWLDDNGYQIPATVDDTLRPYVDAGAVFVAVKLLPGQDTGDLVPLSLRFPGDAPTIPIVPTSVAADPDMGIVVSVLGASRAIPVNYQHVRINEAAIDWVNYGANFMDVVAQAVDEAGGHAFTTEFAGAIPPNSFPLDAYNPTDADLAAVASVTTLGELAEVTCGINTFQNRDPDGMRVLTGVVTPCAGEELGSPSCPNTLGCLGWVHGTEADPIDGAALAAHLRDEVIAPRERLTALFAAQPYLTRFYSTMNPEEMSEDPSFAFNPDLPAVSNVHTASIQFYQCTPDGYTDYQNVRVVLNDGLVIPVGPEGSTKAIRRDRGMTLQKGNEPGAQVIEVLPLSGPPVIVTDNTAQIAAQNFHLPDGPAPDAGPRQYGDYVAPEDNGGGASGCFCAISNTPPAAFDALLAGLLGLSGALVRRRRR